MDKRVLKNIVANYIGRLFGFFSIYIFIPIYISFLGVENYALINFSTVLFSILLIVDLGLSATLNREISRNEDRNYHAHLLRTIEYFYLFIALFVFFGIFISSNIIANRWLNSEILSVEKISFYIRLMGGSIAFQLLFILYNSGLLGLQKQIQSNVLQVLSGFFRNGVVVVPLYFFKSLELFFIWQLLMNVIFFFISRGVLWKYIGRHHSPYFKIEIFKSVGNYTAGMMLMSIIAAVNTQIDKIYVSKMFTLKTYGYYSLASVFAQSTTIMLLPIAVAILPKMTRLAELNHKEYQVNIFHKYSFIIGTISCAITMVLLLYSEPLMVLWTKDREVINIAGKLIKFLLLGGMFLGFQYMPYHLALAYGHTRTNIIIGITMMICFVPALYISVNHFNLLGASLPWLIFNFVSTFFLGYFVINKFLKGNFFKWVYYAILLPIIISLFIGIVFYYFTPRLFNNFHVILECGFIGLINLLVSGLIYLMIFSKKN